MEGGRVTSYVELSYQIRRTAAVLQALGIRPGEPVGLFLREDTRHVVTKLAVIQAGGAAFTLDRRSRPDAERVLRHLPAKTKVLVESGQKIPGDVILIPLDAYWDRQVARQPVGSFSEVDGDIPALITLTSGSTGGAKAVASTHHQQMWRYLQKSFYLGMVGHERYLSMLPLTFSAGNNFILYHLMCGNTVVLYPVLFSSSELAESINSLDITTLFLVPAVLESLLTEANGPGLLLTKAPKLVVAGAPINAQSKTRCLDVITPNLYCVYAASGAGWIALADPHDSQHYPDSVGRRVMMSELQIVDDDDKPVPMGHTGRIRCRGETVSEGFYTGFPSEDHRETHRHGFYYPGDLGHLDERGYLYLDGRASTLIIRGGVNIYPEYIESVLAELGAVREVAVCGIPHPQQGEEVVAMVVSGDEISTRELEHFCRERLGVYYRPGHFLLVDKLPHTRTGKIERKTLPSLAESLLRSGG